MRINMSYYFHKLQDKAHISDEPKIKCICSIMSNLFLHVNNKNEGALFRATPPSVNTVLRLSFVF